MHFGRFKTFILLSWMALQLLNGSPSAQAESCFNRFWSSVFGKREAGPDPILSFAPGARVRFARKGAPLEGEVLSHSFDEIRIRSADGKEHRIKSKHSDQITEISPALDPNTLSHRLWALRRKTHLSGKTDLWKDLRDPVQSEIQQIRTLSKAARQTYLEKTGDEIVARLKQRYGHEELGFHYNLHGGALEDYVDRGGIMVSRGDIALNYGHGDPSLKVYFFRSSNISLYHLLSEGNPQLYGAGRMGNVLMVFPYDSDYILRGMKEKGIQKPSSISLDFEEDWVRKQEMSQHTGTSIGIPATEFFAPPAEIFHGLKKKVGLGGLSRDEETLATMRYLEKFWSTFGR
jgi:hypothetical protein